MAGAVRANIFDPPIVGASMQRLSEHQRSKRMQFLRRHRHRQQLSVQPITMGNIDMPCCAGTLNCYFGTGVATYGVLSAGG